MSSAGLLGVCDWTVSPETRRSFWFLISPAQSEWCDLKLIKVFTFFFTGSHSINYLVAIYNSHLIFYTNSFLYFLYLFSFSLFYFFLQGQYVAEWDWILWLCSEGCQFRSRIHYNDVTFGSLIKALNSQLLQGLSDSVFSIVCHFG